MPEYTEETTARRAKTKDWNLRYQEAGEGYPVIMIHGSGPGATGWTNFSRNIPWLAAKYRVIAPDMPGWGKSDLLDPAKKPTVTAGVDALAQLMDHLGIEAAALIGNSLGGAICQEFAVRHPRRISHMITMGAAVLGSANLYSPGGITEGLRVVHETYADPTPANFRRMVSLFVYDPSFVTDELCEMRSRASLQNPQHLKNFLSGLKLGTPGRTTLPHGDLIAGLSRFEAPSLFIHGRDDRVVPMENTFKLVTWTPNSQAHIFNRCGHWTQIEHADAFNNLVGAFLETYAAR